MSQHEIPRAETPVEVWAVRAKTAEGDARRFKRLAMRFARELDSIPATGFLESDIGFIKTRSAARKLIGKKEWSW